jgi:hypothetical protein
MTRTTRLLLWRWATFAVATWTAASRLEPGATTELARGILPYHDGCASRGQSFVQPPGKQGQLLWRLPSRRREICLAEAADRVSRMGLPGFDSSQRL